MRGAAAATRVESGSTADTKEAPDMAKDKKSGKDLHEGDHVAWSSHGSETTGEVEQKITERTEAAGRTVAASEEEPQYEVRSDKSGKTAVHKPSALKKKK
ncbi:DUF2945 domain-containing protein [Streptomyces tunisiensis]|uniref:DUF2945 domain-containing protein n=2 Tax=Streptomyces TaxID=1883 RepID=A0ABP7Z2S0_9ACTN